MRLLLLFTKQPLFLCSITLGVFLLSGCGEKSVSIEPGPDPVVSNSSWEVIQHEILDKHCISCHTAGSTFATQSDLILTADVAYSQLVNTAPQNAAARAAGLLRVGTDGLASHDKSFLWEKINAPNQQHFYDDHPDYGALMPLGGLPLTNGQLAYIEQWIIAGAPETGFVADRALLNDSTRYETPDFTPLDPPLSGEQIHLGPFDVPANYEREFYVYEPLYNNEVLYVNRVEIAMRSGSHHFILYGLDDNIPAAMIPQPGEIRDIRDANGVYNLDNLLITLYHEFVAGTQWPLMDYQFPPGVALRIPANSGFDLNPHYVNRTGEVFQGEIYANLHTVDVSEVQHVARILNLSNTNINLPPNQVTTLSRTWTFNRRRHIFQLFSHAHEHMTEFRVYVVGSPRDGELIYIAYDWEHPPILELDPPLTLESGQGLRLEVTYNNWTSRTLRFGLLSEDEMMILFGAYYE